MFYALLDVSFTVYEDVLFQDLDRNHVGTSMVFKKTSVGSRTYLQGDRGISYLLESFMIRVRMGYGSIMIGKSTKVTIGYIKFGVLCFYD